MENLYSEDFAPIISEEQLSEIDGGQCKVTKKEKCTPEGECLEFDCD